MPRLVVLAKALMQLGTWEDWVEARGGSLRKSVEGQVEELK